MSDYLEDLGRELDRAAARRVAGRRPRRLLVPALAAAAGVTAVVAIVLAAPGGDTPRSANERPATTADAPAPVAPLKDIPPPPRELRGVPITIANGTLVAGLGATYAFRLEQAGWTVVPNPINAESSDVAVTRVSAGANAADAHNLGVALELPVAGAAPELRLVLGYDAAPGEPVPQASTPKPAPYEFRLTPGEVEGSPCVELHLADQPARVNCGDPATATDPLRLVNDIVLDSGVRLVYGYASAEVATVVVNGTERFDTEVQRGVSPFSVAVPGKLTSIRTLDADGKVLVDAGFAEPTEGLPRGSR